MCFTRVWEVLSLILIHIIFYLNNKCRQIMEKGASQRWQELLQEVIGEGRLDGTALREYFRPLEEWLRQENLRNNEFVGWNYDGDYCKHR